VTVLRARTALYGKQVFYGTNNCIIYRCVFVLLFGRYSLQLDNKVSYSTENLQYSKVFISTPLEGPHSAMLLARKVMLYLVFRFR